MQILLERIFERRQEGCRTFHPQAECQESFNYLQVRRANPQDGHVPLAADLRVCQYAGMGMQPCGVDSSRLETALAVHLEVLREEQMLAAAIQERAEEARKVLAECDQGFEASVTKQRVMSQTIAIYHDLLRMRHEAEAINAAMSLVTGGGGAAAERSQAQEEPRLVARIGDQHYRMLHAVRLQAPVDLQKIAELSFVSIRRVRVQMNEDAQRGIVAVADGAYELTPKGADYLGRFEESRRTTNQPLPSLSIERDESDGGEADPAISSDGGENGGQYAAVH